MILFLMCCVIRLYLFACFIELSQYFNLVSLLHMERFKVAKIIIGSTFDLKDILCYFMGTKTKIILKFCFI